MADPQFGSQFEDFTFKLTSVTEADMVAEARAVARQTFPKWDQEKPGDIGFFLLRLYIKSVMQGVSLANAWAQEFNLFTAREESSILAHARRLGFNPSSPRPSRTPVVVTFTPPTAVLVNYPAFSFRASTRAVDGPENEVVFENEFPFSVGASISQVTVQMVAGESKQQTYDGNGEDFQTVVLETSGVIDGSVRVEFLSVPWEEVDDFVNSGPTDLHFVTRLRSDGFTEVIFGDGTNGSRPGDGAAGTVDYRVGGGDASNIPAEALTFVLATPGPFPADVVNPLRATGGQDRDTVDAIIKKATDQVRTRDFIGNVADAVKFSENYDGVARASASLVATNLMVFIIPTSGGGAGTVLKTNLQNAILERIVMGFIPQVADVAYVAPTIEVQFTTRPGYVSSEVEAAVVADLQAMLNPLTQVTDPDTRRLRYRRAFGQTLYVNDVRDVLLQRPEVERDFAILRLDTGTPGVADVPVGATSITTHIGATITATSRNVQMVGFIPATA